MMQSHQQVFQALLRQRQEDASANQHHGATMLYLMQELQERGPNEGASERIPFSNMRGNAGPMAWSGRAGRVPDLEGQVDGLLQHV